MRRLGRQGFVLVSVLTALIVLSGLAAAVGYLVRTAALGAAAVRDDLVMDSLKRSGLEIAGFELFELKRTSAQVNGQQIRLDDGVLTLFVSGESGKIDLNAASPEVLESLWTAIGGAGLSPEQFAARVKDYRDQDSEPEEDGGAEASQYSSTAPGKAPANAPFEMIDDIQNVLGVPLQAARSLAPLVTVHNPGGKISVFDASPDVIRALPKGSTVVDKVMSLRARPPAQGEGDDADDAAKAMKDALGETAKYFSFEPTSAAYTVRVEVARGDARRATTAILTRSRATDALYFVTDVIE